MLLSDITPNPDNPRFIKDEKFKKLLASITDFPKMMNLRPIIVDSNYMILGGNMRYKALQVAGYTEIPEDWIKVADSLTDEEKKRFVIEDNMPFGEWDFEILANTFDMQSLLEWGFDEAELLKGVDLDRIEDVEVDTQRLFVLTVEAPEAPKLKERMAFYCESIEDYERIKKEFIKKGSVLDIEKLLNLI